MVLTLRSTLKEKFKFKSKFWVSGLNQEHSGVYDKEGPREAGIGRILRGGIFLGEGHKPTTRALKRVLGD